MRKNKGFTMIELVAVVVIIGVLAAIASPKAFNMVGNAEQTAITLEAEAIEFKLNQYLLQNKTEPTLAAMEEPVYYYDAHGYIAIENFPAFPAQFPCTNETANQMIGGWITAMRTNLAADLAAQQANPYADPAYIATLQADLAEWTSRTFESRVEVIKPGSPHYQHNKDYCLVEVKYNNGFPFTDFGWFKDVPSEQGTQKIATDFSGICLYATKGAKSFKLLTYKDDAGTPTSSKNDKIIETGDVVEDSTNCTAPVHE